jgi:hypothetical protein
MACGGLGERATLMEVLNAVASTSPPLEAVVIGLRVLGA